MNNRAIISLIVGIMSIFIPLVGLILGFIGIVYANKGMREIEETGQEGRNYALAGKTCSAIGICIQAVLLLIVLVGALLFSSFDQLLP